MALPSTRTASSLGAAFLGFSLTTRSLLALARRFSTSRRRMRGRLVLFLAFLDAFFCHAGSMVLVRAPVLVLPRVIVRLPCGVLRGREASHSCLWRTPRRNRTRFGPLAFLFLLHL